jgi:hypothetical protein
MGSKPGRSRSKTGRRVARTASPLRDGARAHCRRRRVDAGGEGYDYQIKEKYGGLRIYFDDSGLSEDAEARVEEAIEVAEFRTACTCEDCGLEGQLYDNHGWYITRCEAHAEGERCQRCQAKTSASGACSWTASGASSRRTATTARDAFVEVPIAALKDD